MYPVQLDSKNIPPVKPNGNLKFKRKWIFLGFGALLLVIVLIVWIFINLSKQNQTISSTTRVISQDLYSNLKKQQFIAQKIIKNGSITEEEASSVAVTSYSEVGEAIMIDKKQVLLSTGSKGTVTATIPQGKYSVKLQNIPGVDILDVPSEIMVREGKNDLNLGFSQGNGSVAYQKAKVENFKFTEANANFNLLLFRDLNKNGKKDNNEPNLNWAGVVVTLDKI